MNENMLVTLDDAALDDAATRDRGNAALWSTYCDKLKKGTFIPVFLTRDLQFDKRVPVMYNQIRKVFLSEITTLTIEPLLKGHVQKRLERDRQQDRDQLR